MPEDLKDGMSFPEVKTLGTDKRGTSLGIISRNHSRTPSGSLTGKISGKRSQRKKKIAVIKWNCSFRLGVFRGHGRYPSWDHRGRSQKMYNRKLW